MLERKNICVAFALPASYLAASYQSTKGAIQKINRIYVLSVINHFPIVKVWLHIYPSTRALNHIYVSAMIQIDILKFELNVPFDP